MNGAAGPRSGCKKSRYQATLTVVGRQRLGQLFARGISGSRRWSDGRPSRMDAGLPNLLRCRSIATPAVAFAKVAPKDDHPGMSCSESGRWN